MTPRLILVLSLALPSSIAAQDLDRARLEKLKAHPRLLAGDADLARVKENVSTSALARRWKSELEKDARRALDEPPVERKVVPGHGLLQTSRNALARIETLALLYRIDGDRRWAERARKELLAVAAFPDWNPEHFLDVAEMTRAVAIGYDWLHAFLSAEDRRIVKSAIVQRGLEPSRAFYEKKDGWVAASHNWNQVCNGGMVLGALAVADEEPELALSVLRSALESIRLPMARFAPDGAWDEGPGYWNYATTYNVLLVAALETALGSDFGLAETPGFSATGGFRLHFTGPSREPFNFADARANDFPAPQLFWLARRFDRPLDAWAERQISVKPTPLDLLWFDARGEGPAAAKVPLDALFKGAEVAFMRSAWEDPSAVFVAMKGGHNDANHSHLDQGTFVLDGEGERWALDLGPDDYALPGYFKKERRFTYYRTRTEGHNTLVLDGENQDPKASAAIVAFVSSSSRSFAIADLGAAWASKAQSVRRGIALIERRHVLVQDELEARDPVQVTWSMHTLAEIQVQGARATLSRGHSRLFARILEPEGATFEAKDATAPAPQNPNAGARKLAIRLPPTRKLRLAVLLTPSRAEEAPGDRVAVTPLSSW